MGNGVASTLLDWPLDNKISNAVTAIQRGGIELIINLPKNYSESELTNDYLIRRAAVDFNVPLITNAQLAKRVIDAILENSELEIKEWGEY